MMTNKIATTRRLVLTSAAAASFGTAFARPSRAATYPDRPVRIIAPFAPGGPADLLSRLLSARLAEALGQPFYVENRAGAGSNIGTAMVARAAPDGYTLLITSSAFVVNPGLYKQTPFDPVKDFAPLAELVTSPNVFIATKASGIKTMADLVARAKAQPEALNYASAGIGTTPHIAGEWLKFLTGISVTHVPFNGAGPAMQAILSGTVPLACASLPGAHPSILNGDLVALAVTGTERWYDMPNVPTMLELGYKGFVSDTFHGAMAPSGTPRDILDRLATAMSAAMKDQAFAEQLRTLGFEIINKGQDALRQRIALEVPMYRDLIDKTHIDRI
jgi:tripartite-type tricarboxylate transporter receptor subunit TctC